MNSTREICRHMGIHRQLQTFVLGVLLMTCPYCVAGEKYQIKSGTMGSSYCTPFESPRCQAYNQQESERLFERRQYERRIEDLERRERGREMERQWEDRRDSRNWRK